MHNHSNVVIHILVNIPQENTRDDTDGTKRNARQIHILIALSISNLARQYDHFVRGLIARDARDGLESWEQTGGGVSNGFNDIGGICDADFHHGAADVFGGIGDEFVDENVIVHGISDASANDADGQGKGSDRGDDIVGTDDGRHNRSRNHDATDSETAENEETPESVEIVSVGYCKGTAASSHEDGRDDQQFTIVATEDGQEPENETGACENAETDGNAPNADTDWVMTVNIESLSGPEHDDGEEVGARDCGDDQGKGEDSGFFLHS